jgi:hypothetical protein
LFSRRHATWEPEENVPDGLPMLGTKYGWDDEGPEDSKYYNKALGLERPRKGKKLQTAFHSQYSRYFGNIPSKIVKLQPPPGHPGMFCYIILFLLLFYLLQYTFFQVQYYILMKVSIFHYFCSLPILLMLNIVLINNFILMCLNLFDEKRQKYIYYI